MAISFSRPDPSSPAAIAGASFGTSRRGFDQQEVREFLRMVSAELGRLQERERFLERELRSAQAAGGDLTTIDEETATRLLGEETARILTTARESGAVIKARAEEGAGRLLREATDEATRLRQDADLEAARRRSDAAADAEAELSMAKQQGREMVEEARAYRERVLAELARRRDMARQQIEQLISGRDRLVQSFDRARMIAGDVITGLAPLDPPDELIDLSPTTGPVPLTVPVGRIADRTAVSNVPMPGEPAAVDVEGTPDEASAEEVEVEVGAEAEAEVEAEVERSGGGDVPEVAEAEVDDPRSEPVAAEPEPEPELSAEVEPEIDVDVAVEAEIVDDEPVAEPAPAPTPSNVFAFPGGSSAATLAAPRADEATEVDQIFARLRAGRPGAVDPPEELDVSAEADDMPDDETPFSARDAVVVPLIVACARKLKRRLADEQNEILDALRRNEPITDVDALLGDADEQIGRYTDAVTAELAEAGHAGAAAIGGTEAIDLGPDGPLTSPRAAIGSELVMPLRERLARIIDEADGDHDTIAKRVRGLYREWKSQRIDEELDDILRGAYVQAAVASLPAGTMVCWLVDPDGPASPDCEDNSLAEPVSVGDGFPTGHTNPPAHPGCRCLLAVVRH